MYNKLANAIIFSTIWQEAPGTRLVWITMIAMKNRHGEVIATAPGLAHAARVTRAECDEALRVLMAPDPDSSDFEGPYKGARIKPIEGGWWVINSDKYQKLQDDDDKREKDAARQARKRERDCPKSHAGSRRVASSTATATAIYPPVVPLEKGETKPARKKRGPLWHTVPADWSPSKETEHATRVMLAGRYNSEMAKFRDWEFKTGRSDADRAWRNWARSSAERNPIVPTKVDKNERWV